jgi:hypothetical protein
MTPAHILAVAVRAAVPASPADAAAGVHARGRPLAGASP